MFCLGGWESFDVACVGEWDHENRKKTTTRTDTREKYVDNETADTAHKTGHNRNNGAPRARFNVRSEETEKFLDPRRSFIY